MVKDEAQTKQGHSGGHTGPRAETEGQPKQTSIVLGLFIIICEGVKTLSEQLISLFGFFFWSYILCLNPEVIVPKESWDMPGGTPSPLPAPSSLWGLGLESKKLSGSSRLFSFLFRI